MVPRPLIAVVGQTASGKTSLAIDIAKAYKGEIICADSRTVYQDLNISTAKPNLAEQREVPHHLLDILKPSEPYSAADFQKAATRVISDIYSRNNLPIVVGGSGLFVDALLYNFSFKNKADPVLRNELTHRSIKELQAIILQKGLSLPENHKNPRHLVRTIEMNGFIPKKEKLRPDTLLIGLAIDKDTLENRIQSRVHNMIENGLIEEIQQNVSRYGWDAPGLQEPAYKAFRPFIEGRQGLEQSRHELITQHIQFAKRQHTWFKRNRDIVWVNNKSEALNNIQGFMSNYLLQ